MSPDKKIMKSAYLSASSNEMTQPLKNKFARRLQAEQQLAAEKERLTVIL